MRTYSIRIQSNIHSRQIRPPIYSLKQSKLRKRRVWRYAILYFVMLIVFIVLFAGPIILNNYGFTKNLPTISFMDLVQPTNQTNNDTSSEITGKHNATGASATETPAARLVKLF